MTIETGYVIDAETFDAIQEVKRQLYAPLKPDERRDLLNRLDTLLSKAGRVNFRWRIPVVTEPAE